MATSFGTASIGLGVPAVAAPSVTILGLGDQGTVGAKRIATHPDSVNFPPITYSQNPTYTYGLDNDMLRSPITRLIPTLSTSALIRFERVLSDLIAVEVWEAGSGTSMRTSLFRSLYEYLVNPPDVSASSPVYITWQPRDENTKTFNVELFDIRVGGGEGLSAFKMRKFRLPVAAEVAHPLSTIGSLMREEVSVFWRVVSEVTT